MAAMAETIATGTRTLEAELVDHARYSRALKASKRARWDIDADVIRGREFDYSHKFLPDGLSLVDELDFLTDAQARLWSQVQGRTYAYIFGLVERYIGAKVLELSGQHWLGDQVALEALVRFSDEELKHQELFRRIERMLAAHMPAGYVCVPQPNEVAAVVLSKSTWAVLALVCLIELFTQAHYRQSIDPESNLSDLWKDVFLFHWREDSQHAILDELEWLREDARLTEAQRDQAVDDTIALVGAVDSILQAQSTADAAYFFAHCSGRYDNADRQRVAEIVLKAYRWQYIVSGVQEPRFAGLLESLTTPQQMQRIGRALAPLLA